MNHFITLEAAHQHAAELASIFEGRNTSIPTQDQQTIMLLKKELDAARKELACLDEQINLRLKAEQDLAALRGSEQKTKPTGIDAQAQRAVEAIVDAAVGGGYVNFAAEEVLKLIAMTEVTLESRL